MADSSAYIPGHSPGARIQDGVGTSSLASRWAVRRLGAAYIHREQIAVCSANSNICWRVAASLTARPVTLAVRAARTTVGRGVPLEPKPPPTCGETTRTWEASRSNTFASVDAVPDECCVESCTV